MAKQIDLKAEKRNLYGRKIKKLRREGILPGNIYGKGVKSLSIQIDLKTFDNIYKQVRETGLVNLTVDKEKNGRPVLIHNLQKDPVTDEPLHVDFRQVDLTKKVTADIPLEFIGKAPAIDKGGVVVQLLNEVEVEALPANLPDKIEVDISSLAEVGNTVTLKGLEIDASKVKLTEENLNTVVVQVEEPTKEKVEEAPAAPVAEGEEGAAPAEGEAPKEGEKPTEGQEEKPAPADKGKPAKEEKKEEKK